MHALNFNPNRTNEYSIHRRGQVAEKIIQRVFTKDISIAHPELKLELMTQVEEELMLCPASNFVGKDWEEIIQNCLSFLLAKPVNPEPGKIKLRLLMRVLHEEHVVATLN